MSVSQAAKKLTPAQRKAATARRLGTASAKVETGVEAFGTKTSFADFLGVAKTQPGRWLAGKETPRPQTARLVKDVDYLWDRLRTDLSEEAARIWLNSPNPFLNGATPFTWLKQHGPGQVIAAFDAAEAGSYP